MLSCCLYWTVSSDFFCNHTIQKFLEYWVVKLHGNSHRLNTWTWTPLFSIGKFAPPNILTAFFLWCSMLNQTCFAKQLRRWNTTRNKGLIILVVGLIKGNNWFISPGHKGPRLFLAGFHDLRPHLGPCDFQPALRFPHVWANRHHQNGIF